jgi:L-histidine N-alpha-methyltransferase
MPSVEPTPSRPRFSRIATSTTNRLAAFARDVRKGLTANPKHLSCCYFYDDEGSLLFEEICDLPEYYLTRAEREILEARAAELVSGFRTPPTLVELGSGNAAKTRLLIEAFLKRYETLRYVPIDICGTVVEQSSRQLLHDYPGLEILAIAAEYQEGLRHLQEAAVGPRLVLWLGSNVGNLDRLAAAQFLRVIRGTLTAPDSLLIGIDLRKDRPVLERAYADSRGVTADFNLNLLVRINRELGGHFRLEAFEHRAVYNEEAGRIEMYLVSKQNQRVRVDNLNLEIALAHGEAIHTENSYKYSLAEIESLAAGAGYRIASQWFDSQRRFSVSQFAPF